MGQFMPTACRAGLAAIAALCLAAASSLSGQMPTGTGTGSPTPDLRHGAFVGVGYVSNAPNMFLGGNVVVLPRAGWPGVYVDVKTTHDPPSRHAYYEPDITVAMAQGFGDELFRSQEAWTSVNAALVWPVGGELALYGGAGLTRESVFLEYQDPEEQRGRSGFYWIDDPAASGDYLNLLGGILVQAGRRLMFQFGAELRPVGATVGATYLFPIGR
jgi:hypothetical protein